MAQRKQWLSGASAALALCAALAGTPAFAQGAHTLSASSLNTQDGRAGDPEDYAWIDRADALWDVIGDSPPDLAFAFEDVEPWGWQTADGHTIIVEEAAEGMRSFYFEPGSDAPFLAVEPGASFAFESGDLAMAYGPDGTALSELEGTARLEQGMVLFERGRRLKRAMRGGAAQPVDSGAWAESSLYMGGFLDLWHQGFLTQPAWRQQRESQGARRWRDRLDDERVRRRALGDGFRRWREGGFQGPPPARWRRPDVRPGQPPRQGVRPRPGAVRPDAERPNRPRPPGGRPDRPGSRPGAQVPALPPVITTPRPDEGRPIVGRPGRPDRPGRPGWNGTWPGGVVGTPPPVLDTQPGVVRPPRPWGTPRPGWNRPRPVPQPGTGPTEPNGVRPVRSMRPDGRPGWNRRPPIATPAPAAPSGVAPPVVRPVPARPQGRPGGERPRAPDAAPPPAAPPSAASSPPQTRPAPATPRPMRTRPLNVRVPNQD